MSNASSSAATPEPKKHMSGFGNPLLVIVVAVLIFLSGQVVGAILAQLALAASGQTRVNIFDSPMAQFFFILVSQAFVIWAVVKYVKRRGIGLDAIGLGRWPIKSDIAKALLGFAAFYGIFIVTMILIKVLLPVISLDQPQDVGFKTVSGVFDLTLAFVALVIFAPIGEEVLVRGYLYSGLRRAMKFLPATLVSSIIFSLAHLFGGVEELVWGAALSTFVLSLVLVYLREKTGAIYAGIVIHSLNNLIAFSVYFRDVLF